MDLEIRAGRHEARRASHRRRSCRAAGKGFRRRTAFASGEAVDGYVYEAFHKEITNLAKLLRPLWDGSLADEKIRPKEDVLSNLHRRLRLGRARMPSGSKI